LRSLIDNQQDKNSPNYHRWVTPEEFGARFGPADSDIAAVTNWLTASGFEVTQVSRGRTVIEFSGTAGLVKQVFRTAIHKFVFEGEEHWANVNDPAIPTALAPVVTGVNSLHNFEKKAQNKFLGTYSQESKQLSSPAPNFTFNGGCTPPIGNCYALVPYDFATIYDLLPLWNAATPINGTGQTIAIVGRTAIDQTDSPTFWNLFGLDGGCSQPTLVITPNGPMPDINGDELEADIDIQWSGAAADATIAS
jgi:subtilase family serine protease